MKYLQFFAKNASPFDLITSENTFTHISWKTACDVMSWQCLTFHPARGYKDTISVMASDKRNRLFEATHLRGTS
jgi:hypothetical protein